jgi:hypothetical protein
MCELLQESLGCSVGMEIWNNNWAKNTKSYIFNFYFLLVLYFWTFEVCFKGIYIGIICVSEDNQKELNWLLMDKQAVRRVVRSSNTCIVDNNHICVLVNTKRHSAANICLKSP